METPYDQQLAFELIQHYAVSAGKVRVQVNHREWVVRVPERGRRVCASCGRDLRGLQYTYDRGNRCTHCARTDWNRQPWLKPVTPIRKAAKRKEKTWNRQSGERAAAPPLLTLAPQPAGQDRRGDGS